MYVGKHAPPRNGNIDGIILGMVIVLIACAVLIVWGVYAENTACTKSGGVTHLGWCSTATGIRYDPES